MNVCALEAPLPDGSPSLTPLASLDEERAVLARLASGDPKALGQLYRWYGDAVYRAIYARLRDADAAADCLRDTFRVAAEKIDQFASTDRSVFFWLRQIGVRKALDVHRARQRDRRLQDRLQAEDIRPAAPPAPDHRLEVAEVSADVHISLSRMNPRYAEVLRLRLLEERPREDCAEALGVTLGTLDVLFHRACKAFHKVWPP